MRNQGRAAVDYVLVRDLELGLEQPVHLVEGGVAARTPVLDGPAQPAEAGVEDLGPPRLGGRQRPGLVLGVGMGLENADLVRSLPPAAFGGRGLAGGVGLEKGE